MCLFTLVFEWWEKALHIPQVGPLSRVTTYWLKSSGDCKTPSWDPRIRWVIRNQQHFACSKVIFHIFTALYFCGWPCVCRGPFVFQQQYHSRHRCNWNCWGNVGSQCVFWHWILNYGRNLGKCCRSVLLSVFTMYFLKSSGLCRSRTLPKMVMTIICKLMSWPETTTCCFCAVSYACLMPFGFQHWFHKYHRSRQNCWGNVCSRCDF